MTRSITIRSIHVNPQFLKIRGYDKSPSHSMSRRVFDGEDSLSTPCFDSTTVESEIGASIAPGRGSSEAGTPVVFFHERYHKRTATFNKTVL